MSRTKRVLVALAVIVGCAVFVNPYIRGDGNGYYAYVRSVVIDHDLKFQDEFLRGDPAFLRATSPDGVHLADSMTTKPGYVRNQWSVGPSLFWTPFFLVAHIFVKATGHWPADGYSFPYRWFCAFGTAFYTAIALFIARKVAVKVTNDTSATIATVAVFGATSLAVYALFLPFWGLALATLPGSILVWQWSRGASWEPKRWLLYGFLAGLAVTTHPVGISWLALLAVAWFRDKGNLQQRVVAGVASAAGFVIAEIPQMIIRAIAHGDALDLGYRDPFHFFTPQIAKELFSSQHGLFTWTPLTLIALVGLVVLWKKPSQRRLATGLLVTFVAMVYVVSANVAQEQSSFGNRMFVHFTPGFVIGTAVVVSAIRQRHKQAAVFAVGALVVWNGLFAFQWAWGLLPKRQGVDWAVMARQQFTIAPKEIGSVAVRFFTDRQGLIDEVQRRDEQRLQSGQDGV